MKKLILVLAVMAMTGCASNADLWAQTQRMNNFDLVKCANPDYGDTPESALLIGMTQGRQAEACKTAINQRIAAGQMTQQEYTHGMAATTRQQVNVTHYW